MKLTQLAIGSLLLTTGCGLHFSELNTGNIQNGSAASVSEGLRHTGAQVGLNADGYDATFANMVNGATRGTWWAPGNPNVTVLTGSDYWPKQDAEIFLGEGDTTTMAGGSYLVQFTGKATVTNWPQTVDWIVNGVDLQTATLKAGTGYNPDTNTTTATMVVPPTGSAGFYLSFTGTTNGISDLYVMQPTTLGGNTPIPVGTLFTPSAIAFYSQFTLLRYMGLGATNGNITSNWSDRTIPGYHLWSGYVFTSSSGVNKNVSQPWSGWTTGGIPWEVLIALSNASGTDAYINVPSNVSTQYITNLANLFAYGSDGVNPYTGPQSNPVWKPLDPSLRVYIEFSNETWNSGFAQGESRSDGWCNQLSQRALYDYLTNNQNDPQYPGGGANGYNDGAMLEPFSSDSAQQTAFLATYNANPAASTDGGSPQYFSNSATINGYSTGQNWVGLRLVQLSLAFKQAFGETGINASDPGSRVRPVFEWQYGGNWAGALGFIKYAYGSHPVNYYLYGGGGGWYTDNLVGGFSDVSFENPAFADGQSGWNSVGATGVAANGSGMGNPSAPALFAPIESMNGATEVGNTVTITTTQPHNFTAGQSVQVSGVMVSGYNGTFTVASVTSNTLSYQSTTTGLAASGAGMVTGSNSTQNVAYLQPGGSLSQSVEFHGGYADITLYATQTVTYDWYHGLTIKLTPVDGGPAINGGQPISVSEGGSGTFFSTSTNSFAWNRSAAFYTGSSNYTYTVTFTNTLPSGTVFFDNVAIQTVNGMFNETTAAYQNSVLNISKDLESDVNLATQYGLHDVGYEGGYDFNQNMGGSSYSTMGYKGFSSAVPNVGAYANLDPRTKQLAINTLNLFYAAGGTVPIVFEASLNLNGWAVAAPTYFDWNTPKLQAVQYVQQNPQPVTYGLAPGVSFSTSGEWLNTGGTGAWGGTASGTYLVPSGNYVVTLSFGTNYSGPQGQEEPIQVLVDGILIDTLNVNPGLGGNFTVPVGALPAGQHAVELINSASTADVRIPLSAAVLKNE